MSIIIATPVCTPGFAFRVAQSVDSRLTLAGVQFVELTEDMLVGEAYTHLVEHMSRLCRPKETLLILGMYKETLQKAHALMFVWAMERLFESVRVVEMIKVGEKIATRSSELVDSGQPIRFTLSVYSVPV